MMEEERLFKTTDKNIMTRIWEYSRPYLTQIIITFIFLLIMSFLQVIMPVITKNTIDNYIQKSYISLKVSPETAEISMKHKAYSIETDSAVYIPSQVVKSYELKQLESRGLLLNERYFLFKEDHSANLLSKYNFSQSATDRGILVNIEDMKAISDSDLRILRQNDFSGIKFFALIYLALLIITFLFNYFQVIILAIVSENIMYDMRDKLIKHISSLSMDFFNKNPIGRLVTRATNDVAALRELFTDVFIYSAKDILTILGILIVMFKLSVKLSFIMLSILPFIALLLFLFQKYARGAYRNVRTTLAKVNAFLSESISGVSLIQSFNQQENSKDDFRRTSTDYYKANMHQLLIFSVFRPLIDVMSYVTLGVVLYFGGMGIFRGEFTIGVLVAFISYIDMFFRPIFDFSEKYNIYQSAMASSERIFLLMDEKPTVAQPAKPALPQKQIGRIEFRNVSFEYKKGEPVLQNVSFTIEPNMSAAFVGATGAGKSTIINLLMRFYDVTEGQILIDGTDVRDMEVSSLRNYFGLVLQDVFLFSGSVRYNIALNSSITDERIIEYSKYVNADNFISNLPDKYETIINERGSNLSTGQRQLISFARALSKEPKVLILDEATSSIDSETENLIQDAIKKIMSDRTTIAIAHRLSTIQDADVIHVIHKGRIVESGTHSELLSNRKYYHELYRLQYVK